MEISKAKRLKTGLIACLSFSILTLILFFPRRSFEAAISGLNLWLDVVLPALLPFFIASEIMIGMGIVDFLSVLLHSVMRPLFRCPGNSAFIWVMSIASGYPMGAKLVSSFYQAGKITREEGQRILAFCSTSGPLFMVGAVGIGMLGSQEAGRIIAISHYTASILLGFLFKFYGSSQIKPLKTEDNIKHRSSPILFRAFEELVTARTKDGRSYGELMGDAVKNSINSLLMVGGFIILFSVLISLLMEIELIGGITNIIGFFTVLPPAAASFIEGITAGALEITTGCKIISDATLSLCNKLAGIAFLIGWSGFSIHCQAAGLLGNTPISTALYLLTKLVHGFLSALITWTLIVFFYQGDISVFLPTPTSIPHSVPWYNVFLLSLELLAVTLVVLALLSFSAPLVYWLQSNKTSKKSVK